MKEVDGVMGALVDEEQRERLVDRFGSGVAPWAADVPRLAESLARQWGLTIEGPAPRGAVSVVIHCRRADGAAGILKLSPDPALAVSEANILGIWAGTGRVPMVWELDKDKGALLLEAVTPGRSIHEIGELPPLASIAELITDLQSVPLTQRDRGRLRPLHSRITFLFDLWEHRRANGRAADMVPASVLHQGHGRARELAMSQEAGVPLHGDLDPSNVLDGGAERGLVVVDPRGCVGDSTFDAVDWALWRAESVAEVERRVAVLAPGISAPEWRLRAWCKACAPILAVAMANREPERGSELDTLLEYAGCTGSPPRPRGSGSVGS